MERLAPTPDGGEDWTARGTFEVAAGLYRIPLPLPNDALRAVNVYALAGAGSLTLIDGGWGLAASRAALERALAAIELSLTDIAQFLVTHAHRDHYTHAVWIRRELGTAVRLGAGERPAIEALQRPEGPPLQAQLGQLRTNGAGTLAGELETLLSSRKEWDAADWAPPDSWLVEGPLELASGRVVRVVETPGHTSGHVVFVDEAAGVCFAGDHVLPTITPSIGFEPVLSPDPLGSFLTSLAKLRLLPDARLLPAHGPVRPSVHARIDELLAHHARRLDEVEVSVGAGAATAYEVATRLVWTRRGRRFDELDLFNRVLAVSETAAHLVVLGAQGRVSVWGDSGVRRYRPA